MHTQVYMALLLNQRGTQFVTADSQHKFSGVRHQQRLSRI